MKALILDGALMECGILKDIKGVLIDGLKKAGWTAEVLSLKEMRIAPCLGCFKCWVKTPGECITRDEAIDLTKSAAGAELIILLTPVTFGGYSSEIKKAMDRLIPLISPFFAVVNGETHHRQRYKRRPYLTAIGSLTGPDEESERVFKTLVARHALNLQTRHASCVVYENTALPGISEAVNKILNLRSFGK